MWWHILEVEQQASKQEVRESYARLMRQIDQDVDIEGFSKVHTAYREAMNAFKESKGDKKNKEDVTLLHISDLTQLYQNPKQRFDIDRWRYMYARFSFIEEDQLREDYVNFFNEHYVLTKEIWEFVNEFHPICQLKTFKWQDLCNGNCNVTLEELEGLSPEEQVAYVEVKIKSFELMIRNKYYDAVALLDEAMKKYGDKKDLKRWMNVAKVSIGELAVEQEAFDEWAPWNEIEVCSKKLRKCLSKGLYAKGEKYKSQGFKTIVGGKTNG